MKLEIIQEDNRPGAKLKAFKTDELAQDAINKEGEMVRTEIYAKSKAK